MPERRTADRPAPKSALPFSFQRGAPVRVERIENGTSTEVTLDELKPHMEQ